MAELKYLTVVYKYVDSDEFRTFFKEQVADRNCAYSVNKNKLIQTTSWYDGDALSDYAQKLCLDQKCCFCSEKITDYNDRKTLLDGESCHEWCIDMAEDSP